MPDEHRAKRRLRKTSGKTRAGTQDVCSWEDTQETLALLKILALGNAQVEAGKVKPAGEVIARLRAKSVLEG
jgi:hypothetical protein